MFSPPIFIRKKNSVLLFQVSESLSAGILLLIVLIAFYSMIKSDSDMTYMDHWLIYHLVGGKAWRLGPDSALAFGLRLPSGAGDKFQQVFISAYKLNYKALETK